MELVLASGSPHRAKILKESGFSFTVFKPNLEEDDARAGAPAHLFVAHLAGKKAAAASPLFPDAIILAADTMVINAQGELLGKPKSLNQAAEFLRARSDAREEIITGFCLRHGDKSLSGCASSSVQYGKIPKRIRDKILQTNEWRGVCGGLRIEGLIAPYIKARKGDMDNIIGLPMREIRPMLERLGYV